jgi:hypothetical protein
MGPGEPTLIKNAIKVIRGASINTAINEHPKSVIFLKKR